MGSLKKIMMNNLMKKIVIQFVLLSTASLNPVQHFEETHLSRSVASVSKSIFKTLIEDESEETNVVISPTSIHLALSILYHGSSGSTKDALKSFLNYAYIEEQYIQEATQKLLMSYGRQIKELNETIEVANVLFADKDVKIKEDYQKVLQTYLFSEVRQVDYSEPIKSAEDINSWVQNKTRDLITDFISPDLITEESKLLLLNAIYFKADWMNYFDKLDTVSRAFTVREGVIKNVDIMAQTNVFPYKYNYDFDSQIISLPYQDENFSMLVILPFEEGNDKVNEVIEKVLEEDLNTILRGMEETDVEIYLPKFKLGYKSQLVKALQKNNLTNLFLNGNFSRISDEDLEVSDVVHETKIEVTEEGSEAAGVTGVLLGVRSGPPANVEQMIVNRPFVFVIHDKKNNIPLFIGKIASPTESIVNIADNSIEEKPQSPVTTFSDGFPSVIASAERKEESSPANPIGVRREDILKLTEGLDPEDKAHFLNNPQEILLEADGLHVNCTLVNLNEMINSKKVMFPCGGRDTQPIEDYKKLHGDPSTYGVNGEQAALQSNAGI